MKKGLVAILILVLCLSFSGCGKSDSRTPESDVVQTASGDNAASDAVVTFAAVHDIKDMNAHKTAAAQVAQNMVFENLVTSTPNGLEPCLATSWGVSEDGLVYTFHLRESVFFHDGTPFNAEAAKANIDAVQSNKESFSWLQLSQAIDHVDVVDEYTINIVLKHTYYPTLAELSLTRPYGMTSLNDFIDGETKDGVSGYHGTGPYILTEHVTDEYATFVANEDYWGGVPEIGTFVWKVMPSGQTSYLAMLNGEINFSFPSSHDLLDEDMLNSLEKDGGFTVYRSEPTATDMIIVNTNTGFKALKDVSVRNAIWIAINRDNIANGVLSGNAISATTMFSSNVPYCDIGLDAKGFDVEKAHSLLESAGWTYENGSSYRSKDGQDLEISVIYRSGSNRKTICELIQSDLAAVGIKLVINELESAAYNSTRAAGEYDIALDQTWGNPYDAATTLAAMLPGGSYTHALKGLNNVENIEEAINEILSSTDEKERQELYKFVLSTIHEQATMIPITYVRIVMAASQEIGNVTFNYSQYEIPVERFTWLG